MPLLILKKRVKWSLLLQKNLLSHRLILWLFQTCLLSIFHGKQLNILKNRILFYHVSSGIFVHLSVQFKLSTFNVNLINNLQIYSFYFTILELLSFFLFNITYLF